MVLNIYVNPITKEYEKVSLVKTHLDLSYDPRLLQICWEIYSEIRRVVTYGILNSERTDVIGEVRKGYYYPDECIVSSPVELLTSGGVGSCYDQALAVAYRLAESRVPYAVAYASDEIGYNHMVAYAKHGTTCFLIETAWSSNRNSVLILHRNELREYFGDDTTIFIEDIGANQFFEKSLTHTDLLSAIRKQSNR